MPLSKKSKRKTLSIDNFRNANKQVRVLFVRLNEVDVKIISYHYNFSQMRQFQIGAELIGNNGRFREE